MEAAHVIMEAKESQDVWAEGPTTRRATSRGPRRGERQENSRRREFSRAQPSVPARALPTGRGRRVLLSLHTQVLISSRKTLTDTARVTSCPNKRASRPQSGRHIK